MDVVTFDSFIVVSWQINCCN